MRVSDCSGSPDPRASRRAGRTFSGKRGARGRNALSIIVSFRMFPIAIEIQRVIVYFDVENFFDGLLDGLNSRIAELEHFTGIGHDDVIVLFVEIRFFVVGLILAELVFADQLAIEQQFDGVVKCGAAYAIIFVFHFDIQILDIKMLFAVVNLAQYGVSLGCFAVPVGFEIVRKNVLYDLLIVVVVDR